MNTYADRIETEDVLQPTSFRRALRDGIAEEMRRDDRVFIIGEDVRQNAGAAAVTQGLADEFGDRRVVNVPRVDNPVIGYAIGAALNGLRPIVEISHWGAQSELVGCLAQSIADRYGSDRPSLTLPIVLRGPDGLSHDGDGSGCHSVAGWVASIPGLCVLAPSNPDDAKALLKIAIRSNEPVVFLEAPTLYESEGAIAADSTGRCEIGRAAIVREGRDVTIVTFATGVPKALDAAQSLQAGDAIEAEVIDLRSLRPIDFDAIIASVRKTGRLVVIEDGWSTSAIASEIIAQITCRGFNHLTCPPIAVTAAGIPAPDALSQKRQAAINPDTIVAKVRQAVNFKAKQGSDDNE